MKILSLAAGLILAAGAALADPVEGIWKTEVDDGAYAHVTISPCGPAICGVISRTFNAQGEYNSENKGKQLVWDMQPGGNGSYANGKIWQPSTGKVFKSKMALSGNTLNVSGCVGPFCKKQTWSRVK
ncbi:DUF2147 domain-containing protein [Thetidibacter halocola]|uniref:DUF2147 domain-containing protein n=1 Tax=Thetidibacter halocola TaxID=2827239 RepID=A0A8J8B8V3_9RHOB|nr:DUF2147 domain-containing protein [Thetidibacter halocola]MBS0125164.1 DUF2147 domain-containing protein [Thetidibacter halocola]